jgi:predicted  nucleic acid-binding Zn-ribbon protein
MNFLSDATKRISQASEKVAQNAARSTKEFSDIFTPNDGKLEKIIKKDMSVRLSVIVWKRRGGLAKLGSYSTAWEKRYMELKGNVLIYYETTGEDTNKNTLSTRTSLSSSPKIPRGYLDLEEEKAAVSASYGHSGAPSPFCISIKVGLAQETKWKLCFDHHQTQMEWLAAISDASIRCSVDNYNQLLLKAADPMNQQDLSLLPRPPPVYEPTAGSGTGGSGQSHTLWALDEYIITSGIDKSTIETTTGSEETKADSASDNSASPAGGTSATENAPLENALQVMESLLAQKEKARATLETNVNSLKGEIETLQRSMQGKDSQISQISSQKSSHLFTIDSLKKEMEEKDSTIQEFSKEMQALQKELAPMEETMQEKNSQITMIAEENETLRLAMEEEITVLKKKLSRKEEKHQKLLWALKEEFARQLQAQQKEIALLKSANSAAESSVGGKQISADNGDKNDDDEFEDCVM